MTTALLLLSTGAAMTGETLSWSKMPLLPPAPGQERQPGVASPFVGVDQGALLVAGGANFPGDPPWRGGRKTWWDTIYVFDGGRWLTGKNFRLPRPLAYGFSASTPYGVVCLGGSDASRCHAEAFLLRWDRKAGKVRITRLPPLPEPLANMGGGEAAGMIYVAGGQTEMSDPRATRHGYVLDFRKGPDGCGPWQRLPDLPGRERILPISFALSGGSHPGFYVFGGRRQEADQIPKLLKDGYRYDPVAKKWSRLGAIANQPGSNLMAGTAVPWGKGGALILGGDNGEAFMPKERLSHDIRRARAGVAKKKTAATEQKLARLLEDERNMLESHKGFSRKIYFYDANADSWQPAGFLPAWAPVTTTAVLFRGAVILPSGEIRPGIRSPVVWKGRAVTQR